MSCISSGHYPTQPEATIESAAAAQQMVGAVRPSVRPSVCPSAGLQFLSPSPATLPGEMDGPGDASVGYHHRMAILYLRGAHSSSGAPTRFWVTQSGASDCQRPDVF